MRQRIAKKIATNHIRFGKRYPKRMLEKAMNIWYSKRLKRIGAVSDSAW